jgi:hypothetical protein
MRQKYRRGAGGATNIIVHRIRHSNLASTCKEAPSRLLFARRRSVRHCSIGAWAPQPRGLHTSTIDDPDTPGARSAAEAAHERRRAHVCAVLPRPGDRSSRVAPRSPGSGAAASRPPPRRYPPGGADIQVTTVVNSVLTRTDLQNIAQLLDNSNSGSAARPARRYRPSARLGLTG